MTFSWRWIAKPMYCCVKLRTWIGLYFNTHPQFAFCFDFLDSFRKWLWLICPWAKQNQLQFQNKTLVDSSYIKAFTGLPLQVNHSAAYTLFISAFTHRVSTERKKINKKHTVKIHHTLVYALDLFEGSSSGEFWTPCLLKPQVQCPFPHACLQWVVPCASSAWSRWDGSAWHHTSRHSGMSNRRSQAWAWQAQPHCTAIWE